MTALKTKPLKPKETTSKRKVAKRKITSPIGDLYIEATAEALTSLYWAEKKTPTMSHGEDSAQAISQAQAILDQSEKELKEYFLGQRQNFSIPLSPEGTSFQKQVWGSLQKIPYGETVAYGWQADKIGNPKAVRAVGTANGANPLAIVIPCHRVIRADKSLGGYGGGLPMKKFLLSLEADNLSYPH
jgi:methylated-DNA-[protein]-cysteine S-methyltransferase